MIRQGVYAALVVACFAGGAIARADDGAGVGTWGIVSRAEAATPQMAGPSGTPIEIVPQSGPVSQVAIACPAAGAILLAPNVASVLVFLYNPATNQTVWINFGGAAAVTGPPSYGLAPGTSISWAADGYVPTSQINCGVPTGTATVTLIYR